MKAKRRNQLGTVYYCNTQRKWRAVFVAPDRKERILVYDGRREQEAHFALAVAKAEYAYVLLCNDFGADVAQQLLFQLDVLAVISEEVSRGASPLRDRVWKY